MQADEVLLTPQIVIIIEEKIATFTRQRTDSEQRVGRIN